jgi:mannose-1-phosphate guanylyltransferase / phosphomannomutase
VLPGLLGALHAEIVSLNAYAAPGRLSRTEQEFQESLERLGGIVRSIRADLGLWIDPGGEVMHLVDDEGRALPPELTQLIFVELALDYLNVRNVAIPVTSPAAVADLIRAREGTVLWTKTEHHAMMASAEKADLVAGTRGEFIFPHFIPAYDGMYAAAKLLEGLALSGLKLSELLDRHPRMHIRQERVACPWGRKGAVMRRLMQDTEQERRQLVDGVKIWKSEREWAMIIPHSDKPYFVVTVEAPDEDGADALLDRYSGYVAMWRDEA